MGVYKDDSGTWRVNYRYTTWQSLGKPMRRALFKSQQS